MKHINLTIQEVLRYGSLGEVEGISPEIACRILEEYITPHDTSKEDELYSAVDEAVMILNSVL